MLAAVEENDSREYSFWFGIAGENGGRFVDTIKITHEMSGTNLAEVTIFVGKIYILKLFYRISNYYSQIHFISQHRAVI